MNRGLTRGRLPFTALQHVAHDHFVDRVVWNPGATHSFTNDERAQLRPRQGRQAAQVPADGGAAGTDDYWSELIVGHLVIPTEEWAR